MARARAGAGAGAGAGAVAGTGRGGLRGYLGAAVREVFAPTHPKGEVRWVLAPYSGDALPHEHRRLQKLWDHVQTYVDAQEDLRGDLRGGDAVPHAVATEVQDVPAEFESVPDEHLKGWMEGAVSQVFAKTGDGEHFHMQPIAPKEQIASREQLRKIRRFQGHLRDHDRVM